MAVCESLVHYQESLVLSQGSPVLHQVQHIEVQLAGGPSVEAVPQPLPGLLMVSLLLRLLLLV